MAILSGWCLIACLSVFFAGITAITETRYVRAGTDETLSCPINGSVVTAGWFYYESRDGYTGDFIYIAVKSNPDTSYPRKDRIAVMYDRNNGVYDLTLLNFNGQTDVGLFACSTVMQNSEVFYHYYTVEFADGPSTASITGNVPVFADDSSSLTLICAATANPGVTFQWKNGNNIIGYSNNLTLSPAREDNGLTVTCTAINREYDDIRASDSVTLEVYYGPRSVTITGRPVYADGTNRLTLTCTAEEYSPGVEFQWKEGSQNINEQNTNTYTKIADKTDNGRTLTCLTWNTMFSNKRKETSRQLTVYYDPDSADIVGTSTFYGDDVNTLTFTYTAAASYPGVRFEWTTDGASIGDKICCCQCCSHRGSLASIPILFSQIHTEMLGSFMAWGILNDGAFSTEMLVSVLNPRAGDDVTIVCTCASNPAPSFTITRPTGWTHLLGRLYLDNVFRVDSDKYTCTAGDDYDNQTKTIEIIVNSTDTDDLKTKEINVMTLAGAVSGSVGVLLIVIATVVLWRRGVISKLNSSCRKNNESTGQDVYQNQAFDPVSAERNSTNEAIYQEIGPSENPAMHYESMTH